MSYLFSYATSTSWNRSVARRLQWTEGEVATWTDSQLQSLRGNATIPIAAAVFREAPHWAFAMREDLLPMREGCDEDTRQDSPEAWAGLSSSCTSWTRALAGLPAEFHRAIRLNLSDKLDVAANEVCGRPAHTQKWPTLDPDGAKWRARSNILYTVNDSHN